MERWLDDTEQGAWRAFVEASQVLFEHVDADLRAASGLSHADYEILVRLSEAPGRTMRMRDLAGAALFSRSRLSHAVARLEADGLVARRPCADDRRGIDATLTAAGAAVLAAAAPAHVASVRRLVFDRLSARDVAALRRISDLLRTARAV